MFISSIHTIEQFKQILLELPQEVYAKSCEVLSNSSIGQHTRHIIELYLCLIQGYESADVSYDRRERNLKIEQDPAFAIQQLERIQNELEKPNKEVKITYELGGNEAVLDSNYFREVMYNLEHTIHHHALIKVGIKHLTDLQLPESFGVAPSTLQYREACAQ
ncbi:DinB family protein [Flagellimonas allohymeniacidonis]|uniref:DinB family protein n=1 Tax=Flagellimonas allohymeniacidonis TaxID=2517819 RepID=A0A4Q8Q9A6_9FLAO|nr:DinB family protein [Allomuricauda hymeniacidonis]TAI46845.1 DinB family protein [Allomuricauda hymeniacidonis]